MPRPIFSPHLRPATTAAAILFFAVPAFAQPVNPDEIREGEKLSQWLLRRTPQPEDYLSGAMWLSAAEIASQQQLKNSLLQAADRQPISAGLHTWIEQRPVTGRVTLASADGIWLATHPSQDPVLHTQDRIVIPQRPKNVSVVMENGQVCQVRHQAAALALEYLQACVADAQQHEQAWVAQPDGTQLSFGIAPWNAQNQLPPAPGAWIWAPQRQSGITAQWSEQFIKFLATQGPNTDIGSKSHFSHLAPQNTWGSSGLQPQMHAASKASFQAFPISSNTWGEIGLLQTPSARMEGAGSMRVHISRTQPYTRATVMFQPLDWLEGGFRYTDIADRDYDPTHTIASQSYKDKSLDVKIRLWPESTYVPQIALGLRDLGGTGLFSSEYVVASKRYGNFDWSLGLGWGYLGQRGDLSNPFGLISSKAKQRPNADVGMGGEVGLDAMFRGPVGIFGGVHWQSPWQPWSVKVELDGNNYKKEPSGSGRLEQRFPVNFGTVYRYSPTTDISVGLERGNKLMVGVTFRNKMADAGTVKPFDPVAPSIAATAPTAAPRPLEHSAQQIERLTGWDVQSLTQSGNTLSARLHDNHTTFRQERFDKTLRVLHQDAPQQIEKFQIDFEDRGLGITRRQVDRHAWVTQNTQALPPSLQPSAPSTEPLQAQPPTSVTGQDNYLNPQRLHYTLTPSFWQSFGGPDAFMLYQIGAFARAEYRFTPSTWVSGGANLRILDNYDKFKYTASSNLPRVRTLIREYATNSRLTIDHLQLTHTRQLSTNQFGSVYAGLLERMYAGVGAEWLYRPLGSRWAVGLDVNHVKQRDFDQKLSLRDYTATTGHASVYWDTGWQDVRAKLSVGQYLAKDKGATLDLSRTFKNGVVMGAWATKTNVSAEQFGEGSFDKGIYVKFPMDLFLPRSSSSNATFVWQPLLRDGGARLQRSVELHTLTEGRDRMAWEYAPKINAPQPMTTGAKIFSE